MKQFIYTKKKIVNRELIYPVNDLAFLFLMLLQSRKAKTFSQKNFLIIKQLSEILEFEMIENK